MGTPTAAGVPATFRAPDAPPWKTSTAVLSRGQRIWAAAQRAYAEAEEAARHQREDAEARASELLTEAAVGAERIGRETERLLRRDQERGAELREHLVRVQGALAELTGRLGQPVGADRR